MSVIKFPLLFVGSKGEKNLYTLFDSGANLSCINPDLVVGLETPTSLGRERAIATAAEGHYIKVKEAIRIDFYLTHIYPNLKILFILCFKLKKKYKIQKI